MEIAEPGSSVNAIQRERNENQAGECSGVNQNAETGKARLYKAAKDGNFDAFKDAKSVEQLVTTNGNSVLHIYITARPLPQDDDENNIETMYLVSNFLKKIRKVPLNRLFSASIRELSLHLAPSKATDEPVNFVRQIVKLCPDLLWTTNIRDEELFKKNFDRMECTHNDQPTNVCAPFARKFAPRALDPLLGLASKIFGY